MIKTKISGNDAFVNFTKSLPVKMVRSGMMALTKSVVGDDKRGLKHTPRYKHVTRKVGMSHLSYTTKGGKRVRGYASRKQHAWVMLNYEARKMGTNQRKNEYQNGWRREPKNLAWRVVDVINRVAHAQWVGGPNQARLNAKVGWRKMTDIVRSNIKGAIKEGQRAVNEMIAKRG